MANETTLNLKLKVNDDGSVVLDRFGKSVKKVASDVDGMSKSLSLIKWDAIVSLGEKALGMGRAFFDSARGVASWADEVQRTSKVLGMGTREFQEWSLIARMVDVDVGRFSLAMRGLISSMDDAKQGQREASDVMKFLGVSAGDNLSTALTKTASKFFDLKDGADKTALSMKVFGERVGMDMVAFLNLGEKGVNDLRKRFNDLGLVVDDITLNRIAASDSKFKDWGAQMDLFRVNILSPLIDDFFKVLDVISKIQAVKLPSWLGIKTLTGEEGLRRELEIARETLSKGIADRASPEFVKLYQEKIRKLSEELYGIPYGAARGGEAFSIKGEVPTFGEIGKGTAGADKFSYVSGMPSGFTDYFSELSNETAITIEGITRSLKEWEAIYSALGDAEQSRAIRSDEFVSSIEQIVQMEERSLDLVNKRVAAEERLTEAYHKQFGIRGDEFVSSNEQILAMDYRSLDLLERRAAEQDKLAKETERAAKEARAPWVEASKDMTMAWITGIQGMAIAGYQWKDVMNNVFSSILNSFNRMLENMVSKWIESLFTMQAASGGGGGGGLGKGGIFAGIGNWFGSTFMPSGVGQNFRLSPEALFESYTLPFASGGLVNRPTLGLIGEAGPEAVIPLRNGKVPVEGGGGTTNIIINAVDAASFTQLCERNPGGIISALGKSSRARGPMSSIIRNG